MMRSASIAALVLLLGACGERDLPSYSNTTGGGSRGGTTTSGQEADGGSASDGGRSTTCPGDPDGVGSGSSIIVSEIGFGSDGFLEFYNRASTSLSLGGLRFSGSVSSLNLGSSSLEPEQRAITSIGLSANAGEIAVFDSNQTMVQYVCWGQQPVTELQNAAAAQGMWLSSGACVASPAPGQTLHLRGAGNSLIDYTAAAPTPLGCP